MELKKAIFELSQEDLREMSAILHDVMRNEALEVARAIRKACKPNQTADIPLDTILDIVMAKPAKREAVKKAPRWLWHMVVSFITADREKGVYTFNWIVSVTEYSDGSMDVLAVAPNGKALRDEIPNAKKFFNRRPGRREVMQLETESMLAELGGSGSWGS